MHIKANTQTKYYLSNKDIQRLRDGISTIGDSKNGTLTRAILRSYLE